jgi:hypothetical protein
MLNELFMFFHFLSYNEILYIDVLVSVSFLLFLGKKTAAELLQYIFTSLDMESTTLRLKINFLNQIACVVAS